MKRLYCFLAILAVLASCGAPKAVSGRPETMSYLVDVNGSTSDRLSIKLNVSGFNGDTLVLRMPAWAPGYYMIMDYAEKVKDFKVGDGLVWTQSDGNTWKIAAKGRTEIAVSYDLEVNARHSVCEVDLADRYLFLPGNGVFLYPVGALDTPVSVRFAERKEWKRIVTGLDKSGDGSFFAKDFDILYDSPFYLGDPWYTSFELDGKKYEISIADTGTLDLQRFVGDIKKIITSATGIIGEIPYRHYSFILLGAGGGGLEHWNSQASYLGNYISSKGPGYIATLSFIAHEFFHLYNVKAIRPIELGPFDYNATCRTNSLWFSEGGTVYYEKVILERAGFITHEDLVADVENVRKGYESHEGHLRQTLAESSWNVWEQFLDFLDPSTDDAHISYYDKGYVVSYRLDEAIKAATKGKKSLDDLMKFLYDRYYKELGRGFTEDEFWSAVSGIAGNPLEEIQDQVYRLP
jgi:predicted metalloprotease with PDZ domain